MKEEHHIIVQKTARYFTLGDLNKASQVWFVLHGYGQDVSRFIEDFNVLVDDSTAVVAPEGLHRFYRKGFFGDVGASWMTKVDRHNDIDDYVSYLNKLKKELISDRQTIQILGFSQGSATACRWLSSGEVNAQNLILWAGLVPRDISIDSGVSNLKKTRLIIAYSETDELRTSELWANQSKLLQANKLTYQEFVYTGGHEVVEGELTRLVETYINPLLSR